MIRAIEDFTAFLGRSPDTAPPEDQRASHLHMADRDVTPLTYKARIIAPGFSLRRLAGGLG